jgi:lysozyme family protein
MSCEETPALDAALTELLSVEGDFSDHEFDSGGATRFGITRQVAREHGYTGSMRDLPKQTAREIYRTAYWQPSGAQDLAEEHPQLAFELFEYGVNAGVSRAVRDLQEICNAANRNETDYSDIAEDGAWGPQTSGAVHAYADERGDVGVLEKGLDGQQAAFYLSLARQNPRKYENFYVGWVDKRIGTDAVFS